MGAIDIGTRREVFWDEHLIDTDKSTAELTLHKPQIKELVIEHDQAWEINACNYHNILKDNGIYRMYYLAWESMNPEMTAHYARPPVVCYAQSTDGIQWEKPKLGLCEFDGSKENNIILDENHAKFDNFFVFKDTNPACVEDEIYKGIGLDNDDKCLWCYTSGDGIHFKKAWMMTKQGKFDTLNVAFWYPYEECYICYIRDFHKDRDKDIRDIRWMTSKDFKNWTKPVLLDFGGSEDHPLYTNVIQPYYRADHVLIGFPSRYVEKQEWTPNFDQLAGAQNRKKRMSLSPRYGLSITDCVLMSSRDGKTWNRWDEAFMTPGIERELNWVYGDCYPAVGMIETKSDLLYAPNELSMYAFDYHWDLRPSVLRRYTIRIDGFVSYHAPYTPCKVVTKAILFKGNSLSINFSTSAIGFIKIKLMNEEKTIHSMEIFGDSLDRLVEFEDGDVGFFSEKPVIMEITMSDADIYSFKFNT